jgi:Major Facilitator Superfamily/Cyclic nucleotide-binding domain
MALAERMRVPFGAFRAAGTNRGIRLVQAARLASVTGRWSYTVALAVFAYQASGAGGVAFAGIVRLAPAAAAAPFTGALVQRVQTSRLMVSMGLLRTLALCVAGAVALGSDATWAVYACVVVEAAASTVLRPIQNSLLPFLSRTPEELTSTYLTLSVIESIGVLLGPLLGAALLASSEVGTVFLVGAGAYLLSALLLVPIGALARDHGRDNVDGAVSNTRASVRRVVAERGTAVVLTLYGAQNFAVGALNVLTVLLALRVLHLGESGVGTLTAALGLGGVIGGGLMLSRLRNRRYGADLALGMLLCSVPLALLAVPSAELGALALLVLVGTGVTLVDVASVTLVQRLVPRDLFAHALGLLQAIFVTSIGIGTLVAPLLAAALGVRRALVAAAAPALLLSAARWRSLRAFDATRAGSAWTDLLAGTPIFAPLPQAALERVASAIHPIAVAAGRVVVAQGDPGDSYYLIEDGELDVEIDGTYVRTLVRGDAFGEIALLRDTPRTATIRARTDGRLLELDRAPFLATVTGNPASSTAAETVVEGWLTAGRQP